MKSIDNAIEILKKDFESWINRQHFQLALFNIVLIILTLLRSAGYFAPFFLITINIIVLISLILLITLLKTKSKFIFVLALCFWIFAGVLKMLQVSVWAERTVVYAFEAMLVGLIQLIIETTSFKKKEIVD